MKKNRHSKANRTTKCGKFYTSDCFHQRMAPLSAAIFPNGTDSINRLGFIGSIQPSPTPHPPTPASPKDGIHISGHVGRDTTSGPAIFPHGMPEGQAGIADEGGSLVEVPTIILCTSNVDKRTFCKEHSL